MANKTRSEPGVNELRYTGVYSIHDRVAQDYSQIFEAANDGVALRSFDQFLAQTQYKDDFELVHIGYMRRSVSSIIYQSNPDDVVIVVTRSEANSDGL